MTHTVSNSEIECYRQCPKKHFYNYKEGWLPPEPSVPLARGILWHNVMEAHYRELWRCQQESHRPQAEVLYKVVAPWLYDEQGNQNETQELIAWMYAGYVQHWGVDTRWKIVAVEHAAEFWLPTDRGGRSQFKVRMKLDLVVMDREERLWLVDHKSGKDLPTDKMLELDPQFGLYTWGLRQMGKNVFGQIHSGARTLRYKDPNKPQPFDERFSRTPMYRTDEQLDNIAKDAYLTARRAWRNEPAERAFNPDTCRWRCDYLDPCLMGSKGMNEVDALIGLGFYRGDPYARYK
jgi:hypothetical protein